VALGTLGAVGTLGTVGALVVTPLALLGLTMLTFLNHISTTGDPYEWAIGAQNPPKTSPILLDITIANHDHWTIDPHGHR
jgi:hypothetical protein